jgi:hypothetical protein
LAGSFSSTQLDKGRAMFNCKSGLLAFAAASLLVMSSMDASAALDLKGYRLGKKSPQIRAEVDGIVLFDAHRNRFDQVTSKFCIDGRSLNGERTISILDREIAEPTSGKTYPEDIPIVFVLIRALERYAPCQ